jgi:thiol-disulfide isomerase/thioredoxin
MSIVAKEVEMQQMKMLHKAPGGVGASIGTDLVLLVYAPWCEFCTEMLPDFNALARGLVDDPTVVVAKLRYEPHRAKFVVKSS